MRCLGVDGYVVNIFCGFVIDEKVLVIVFIDRIIVGVGFDVFDKELYVLDELIVFLNVVFVLYIGGYIFELYVVM